MRAYLYVSVYLRSGNCMCPEMVCVGLLCAPELGKNPDSKPDHSQLQDMHPRQTSIRMSRCLCDENCMRPEIVCVGLLCAPRPGVRLTDEYNFRKLGR